MSCSLFGFWDLKISINADMEVSNTFTTIYFKIHINSTITDVIYVPKNANNICNIVVGKSLPNA